MKDLKAIRGRQYILRLIEEGEHEHQDFKFQISDARKIARSISAFANNDGGRLLIGVKDNGVVAGIRNEEDVYMIETAAETFCAPAVKVEMTAYKVEPHIVVLKAEIPKAIQKPVMVKEEHGTMKAYYRVKDENMTAPEMLLRAWKYCSYPDGSLFQIDDRQRLLLNLLETEKELTLERYVVASHSSCAQALDLIGRLIAAGVVNVAHNGTSFVLTL